MCKNRPNRETVGCDECGDHFNSRKSLQEHRRIKHNRMAGAAKQNIGHTVGQYFDKYSQQAAVINHSQYSHQLPPLPSFSPAMTVYPGVVSTQSTVSNRTIIGYHHSKFSTTRSSLPPYSSAVDNVSMLPPTVEQPHLIENNYIVHQDPMMAVHSPAITQHANNQSLHSLQSHHNHHHQSLNSSPFQPLPPRVTMSEFYDNSAIAMDHQTAENSANSGENFGSILRQVYDSEATAASDYHARAAVAASAAASGHIMTANDPYLVPHHMNMQLYDLI